ncbi:hypothetical protein H4S07_006954, partial [Coemansia furcata]
MPNNVPAVIAPGNVPAVVAPGNMPAGPVVANIVERQGFKITNPMRYDDVILDVQNATGEPNQPDAHVAGST